LPTEPVIETIRVTEPNLIEKQELTADEKIIVEKAIEIIDNKKVTD
jgi:hypothetical protein